MFIHKLKAIVDRNICNSFFVIATMRIDVVLARTEIRRPLVRARFAKRISSLCPSSIEIKDADIDYEVTKSDIKILKQIHSLGDEQYKRLMTDMKALQKLEEMESIVEE